MAKHYFSVIIPALNEEIYIGRLMRDLGKQNFKDFEVIIADGKSEDNTVNVAKDYAKNYPLKVVSSKKRNLSHQRNIGAENATGEYFFFIDADNSIPKNFLEEAKNFINKYNCDVVIPKLEAEKQKPWDKLIYPFSTFLIKIFLYTPRPFSTGGNIIVKANFFKKTNGFNEKIFVGEDHDMIRQLYENSAKMRLLTNSFVIFSTRRFEQEGLSAYLKFAFAFCYLIFFRRIENKLYNYQMGGDNFK